MSSSCLYAWGHSYHARSGGHEHLLGPSLFHLVGMTVKLRTLHRFADSKTTPKLSEVKWAQPNAAS